MAEGRVGAIVDWAHRSISHHHGRVDLRSQTRLMVIVGNIRGLGGDEINGHKVMKIMLEAYPPRNETVLTLTRKKFEHFTPSDVLGRIMTFDMQKEEAFEGKLGELQTRLDGIKIKEIARKANKST
ncbi:hypothetical protein ZEAMMB73_Zm00001d030785 [Zea mays]|uniref:Uncharacterized protein n=1 Tax=Zea mays TaxID=4577 RepID=A0A1D6KEF7_MAIZE|nr:hypothetical protein ZEAMMB73_Zm00001d030785 [Zea mays]